MWKCDWNHCQIYGLLLQIWIGFSWGSTPNITISNRTDKWFELFSSAHNSLCNRLENYQDLAKILVIDDNVYSISFLFVVRL